MELIKKANEIAVRSLRACYGPKGIYAGRNQFSDYWSRDSFFASLGALQIGDNEIVRKNLENFALYQKSDGQIPLRIGSKYFILKYLGFPYEFHGPIYDEDKLGNTVVDSNTLYVLAFSEYLKKTKDLAFAKRIYPHFLKCVQWCKEYPEGSSLITERHYSNWMDSVKKKGWVFYTNLTFWKACAEMNYISKFLKIPFDESLAEKSKEAINKAFWNGNYFSDWVDTKREDYFPTSENFLAVAWGFATKEQSKKIMKKLTEVKKEEISLPVYPRYDKNLSHPGLALLGLGGYHSTMSWLWTSCVEALAWEKIGNHKNAIQILENISKLIIKHDNVYEVYSGDTPFKNLFYTSEHPFAWSSGLFIYAVKKIT